MPSEEKKRETEASFSGSADIVWIPTAGWCVSARGILGVERERTCPARGMTFTEGRLAPTDCRLFMAGSRMRIPGVGGSLCSAVAGDGLFYLPVQPTSVECAPVGHSDLESRSSVWEKAV